MAGRDTAQTRSIEDSLRRLADALPPHAEESHTRHIIHEAALVEVILGCGVSEESAVGQIALIRRIFAAMGLLDGRKLCRDEWAFVSYPAMLLAKSTLETLSTPGQQFFVQGYWTQGRHRTEAEEDAQRELISYLENLRVTSHPQGEAQPIRVVHVAWGFIKLNGRFVFHRREDKARPGTKQYVPPGGRVIPEDLRQADQSTDTLRSFWSPGAALPNHAYQSALNRELAEELSLNDGDFHATYIRTLDSFSQVEGSANHRAYTRYHINVYSIELTRTGELTVLESIHQNPESWTWFTADELTTGKNASGHYAYIDALTQAEQLDPTEFLSSRIPDSEPARKHSKAPWRAIQIPASPQGLIYSGKSGKQRPVSYALSLDEWSLLIILAWHRLGHAVSVSSEMIDILGGGWVRLKDNKFSALAKGIAIALQPRDIPILDIEDNGYCRLDYCPENVFLDPTAFQYEWLTDDPKKRIRLVLRDIMTPYASLRGTSSLITLANEFAKDIAKVEEGRAPDGDFVRQCRAHFRYPASLGLRVFASELAGTFEITAKRTAT